MSKADTIAQDTQGVDTDIPIVRRVDSRAESIPEEKYYKHDPSKLHLNK